VRKLVTHVRREEGKELVATSAINARLLSVIRGSDLTMTMGCAFHSQAAVALRRTLLLRLLSDLLCVIVLALAFFFFYRLKKPIVALLEV
jgi:hypothetical protein